MVRRTLDAMADGGIHDQLGGGFARYSTDGQWLVPHFEKMLYDNAQLARAYLHAWQLTGEARYRAVVEDTLDYVARELTLPDGPFAASQDADTEGVEGATYTWTLEEVTRHLGPATALFSAAYDVRPGGNWEGHTILRRIASDAQLAERFGLTEAAVARSLAEARARLLAVRRARPQPARDDKAIAAWNGLALAAFAEASVALGRDDYRAAAERAAACLLTRLVGPDGHLRRTWKDGRAGPGCRPGGSRRPGGGPAGALRGHVRRALVHRRPRPPRRGPRAVRAPRKGASTTRRPITRRSSRGPVACRTTRCPSGNAMATTALLRLAALTGEARYRDAAEAALRTVGDLPARHPQAFPQWLVAFQLAGRPFDEVAIVGSPDAPARAELIADGQGHPPAVDRRRGRLARGERRVGRGPPPRAARDRRRADRLRVPRLRLPAAGDRPARAAGAAGGGTGFVMRRAARPGAGSGRPAAPPQAVAAAPQRIDRPRDGVADGGRQQATWPPRGASRDGGW